MNSADLLNAMEQLTTLSKKLKTSVTEDDLRLLEKCLDRENRRSYGWSSTPQHAMASAVVHRLLDFYPNACPRDALSRLVRLAILAGADPSPIVARAIAETAYPQVSSMLDLEDVNVTSAIAGAFADSRGATLGGVIIAAKSLPAYLDVGKAQFAGIDFYPFVKALIDCAGVDKTAQAFSFLLAARKDDALSRIEVFVRAFGRTRSEEVVIALGEIMASTWASYLDNRRSYYRSDEMERIRKEYSRCRDIGRQALRSTPFSQLLDFFDALCDLPFHQHRDLSEGAKKLAASLGCLTPQSASVVQGILRLVGMHRIHPAAIRYALVNVTPTIRSDFLALLRVVDSSLAEKISGGPAVAPRRAPVIYDDDGTCVEAYDPAARIWPKNYAIAAKLFGPIEKARAEFAKVMVSEWQRDENSLSERLMSCLWVELDRFSKDGDLQRWIADKFRYGSLRVSEPYVRHKEAEWAADIGIVVEYHVCGTLFHTWGYLLQAKKAVGFHRERPTRWDIDRGQAEDLVLRTRAAYYLLYTPLREPGIPYVVPARAVLSCLDASEKDKSKDCHSISYQAGRALARSWSVFFLEDVVGAWSGEPDPEMVSLIRDGVAAKTVFDVRIAVGAE